MRWVLGVAQKLTAVLRQRADGKFGISVKKQVGKCPHRPAAR